MTERLVSMNIQLGVFNTVEAKEQGSRFTHVRWNIVKFDSSRFHDVQGIIAKERRCSLKNEGCKIVATGTAADENADHDAAMELMDGMRELLGLAQ